MTELHTETEFFKRNQDALERRYAGKVLVIHGSRVVLVYEDTLRARRGAEQEFPAGSCLIREIERPAMRCLR